MARRAGKWDLMTMSLPDRREVPLLPDDDFPYDPLWSPDSKRLAYVRWKYSTKTSQVMMCSTESRNQNPVTDVLDGFVSLYEWSVKGDQLVLSMKNAGTGRRELWLLPMAAAPHAQVAAQKLLSDPDGSTHQGHISPDGRWIAFEVVRVPSTGATSTLYAMRTAGGPWIPLTGGQQWDDKPRWSPDGKIIYFLSGRRGFFNIWGLHFDTATGKPTGEPFQVTHFNTPNLMVFRQRGARRHIAHPEPSCRSC
jgi:Tol biopolymer transport system component